MRTPNVEVKVGPSSLIIEIKGVPHLILRRADLSGIEAWIRRIGVVETYYQIEFTLGSSTIMTDYDSRDLWEEILRKLAAAKIFDEMEGEPDRRTT